MEWWNNGILGIRSATNNFLIAFIPLDPSFHHSSIPWPRPGFYMAPLIILMSRQGGPSFQLRSGAELSSVHDITITHRSLNKFVLRLILVSGFRCQCSGVREKSRKTLNTPAERKPDT